MLSLNSIDASRDRHSPIQCRALFLSLVESILLLCFELLICYNLEQPNQPDFRLTWIVCFLPLIILSIISVFTYVWLLRHGRSWEVMPKADLLRSIDLF